MPATGFRCSTAARERHDPLFATATPTRRFLLVEVPGPWPRQPMRHARLDHGVADLLAAQADGAGARLLLIRRPGRHPDVPHSGGLSWAIADISPQVETVRWGRFRDDTELLAIDVAAALDPAADRASGPQRVALVCTHGTRDVCCAVRGRPVAQAVAAVAGWDVWECTHVGGDRFAANIVVLPTGDMFGQLDPDTAPGVLQQHEAGRLSRAHHRGRCGTSPIEQAAIALVAEAIDDDARGAVLVGPVRDAPTNILTARNLLTGGAPPDAMWDVAVVHAGQGYVARISGSWGPPAKLQCSGGVGVRARRYALDSLALIRPEQLLSSPRG